jgi:gentisate 1,2-dioxygenase
MASSTQRSKEQRLETLNEDLLKMGLRGYWMEMPPKKEEQPSLLKWDDIYPLLMEAGEVVTIGPEVERRNLGGYQVVMPGETALAHRHSQSAMRFVMESTGEASTTTNGEQEFMLPGDLMVQPSWGWHDHTNPGTDPVIWMDILDLQMVGLLGPRLREYWTEGSAQPVVQSQGYAGRRYGNLRPPGANPTTDPAPMAYPWADTYASLLETAKYEEADEYDGFILEYINAATGGGVVPTTTATIQMLRPGEETGVHRHMGHMRYSVVQGEGELVVDLTDTQTIEWGLKDTFTLPSWRWHKLRNVSKTEPAILFCVSDQAAYKAFGFYREERR